MYTPITRRSISLIQRGPRLSSMNKSPRYIEIPKSTIRSFSKAIIYREVGSTSSSTTSNASKTLKASSFTQPKPQQPEQASKPKQLPEVSQEDIDDFEMTKLVHGETKLNIAITKRASDKLNSIAEDDKNPETALRIRVESGGCHGFQYNLDLTTISKELSNDDSLIVFSRGDADVKVIFDESSLEILQDSKIDYTKELIGSSFKVVDSPYTSTECGCGASFDFDFDKLQKKLDAADK